MKLPRGFRAVIGPYRVVGSSRPFRFLFIGTTLSSFIDWLYLVALFTLAYHITQSATVVAFLTFTRLLPYAVLSPLSGALSDRYNRTAIMAIACLGRTACMFGLLAVTARATLPLAFVLVFISSCFSSLFKPALLSVIPAIVEERELFDANSVLSQIDMLSLGAGPALASVILAVGSVRAAFLVAGIGLVVSAVAVLLARAPTMQKRTLTAGGGFLDHTLGGYRFLKHAHDGALLAVVVALAGLSLEGGAVWAILVDLSHGSYHLGDGGPGYIMVAYVTGGLIAGFLVGRAIVYRDVTMLFITGTAVSSLGFIGIGLSPAGIWPFCSLFVVGVADIFSKVPATTAIQTATPDDVLGRVFGTVESALVLSMVTGSLIVAPLIVTLGSRAAAVTVGGLGLLLLAVALPRLRYLERVLGIRVFLRQMPVLNFVPFDRLDHVVERLQVERVTSGQDIIRQGDTGDRMYIIRRGTVEINVVGADGVERTINELSRMDYFGEIALLRDAPRNATVRSKGDVELYSLMREDFEELRTGAAEFEQAMQSVVAARDAMRLQAIFPA